MKLCIGDRLRFRHILGTGYQKTVYTILDIDTTRTLKIRGDLLHSDHFLLEWTDGGVICKKWAYDYDVMTDSISNGRVKLVGSFGVPFKYIPKLKI